MRLSPNSRPARRTTYTLEFKKAFETVEHHGIWQALLPQRTSILVHRTHGRTSACFPTTSHQTRSPLSSLLFNAALPRQELERSVGTKENRSQRIGEDWSQKETTGLTSDQVLENLGLTETRKLRDFSRPGNAHKKHRLGPLSAASGRHADDRGHFLRRGCYCLLPAGPGCAFRWQ